MSKKEALKNGFTHHGRYFGIPIWIGYDQSNDLITVAAKWAAMEPLMIMAHHIEGFLRSVFHPDEEPGFQFLRGPKIDVS